MFSTINSNLKRKPLRKLERRILQQISDKWEQNSTTQKYKINLKYGARTKKTKNLIQKNLNKQVWHEIKGYDGT